MKIAFNPSFRPTRTYLHPIVGKIDEYRFTKAVYAKWRKLYRTAEYGIQARFILNNAKPHNDNHYGLKVYYTLTEAAAAWERQNIAARERLAPPVRRICKFVYPNGEVRWGYQTCIASHIHLVGGGKSDWFGELLGVSPSFPRRLKKLKIVGTINDMCKRDLGTFKRIASPTTKIDGDLHSGNVGFYKHNLVCIDFGTDSVSATANDERGGRAHKDYWRNW